MPCAPCRALASRRTPSPVPSAWIRGRTRTLTRAPLLSLAPVLNLTLAPPFELLPPPPPRRTVPLIPDARARADNAIFTASPYCASTPKELARDALVRRLRPRPSASAGRRRAPIRRRPTLPRFAVHGIGSLVSLRSSPSPSPSSARSASSQLWPTETPRRRRGRRRAAGDHLVISSAPPNRLRPI